MNPGLAAARDGDERAFEALVAPYRTELRAYCYRMAGSIDDADDLLQESLLKAWRGLPAFEGRSSLRTWLYRVTSSACIDALKGRSAKKRAEDLGPPADPQAAENPVADNPGAESAEWLGPCPASIYAELALSPEARYSARESVSFAFLAALQLLPPMQRATLIACDVLGFRSAECAELLDTSVTSVESALRRARETVAQRRPTWQPLAPSEARTRALLTKYVEAWNRADAEALVVLLHEDATMSMPPLPVWMHGSAAIQGSIEAMVFAPARGMIFTARPTEANGLPALGVYRDGAPYALQVLSFDGEALRNLTAFLDTRVFAAFDLRP